MNRWDVLVMAGLLIGAVGAGLIYLPAGIIVFGAGLMGLGVAGAVVEAREAQRLASGGDQP